MIAATCTSSRSRRVTLLTAAFALYKRFIGPGLHALSPSRGGCGFQPTCSEYAVLAMSEHGIFRGGAMVFWRLLRCNPWNPHARGAWDPVPIRRGRTRM